MNGAGASTVLISPIGTRSKFAAKLNFRATNNIVEYEALILGLNKAKALDVQKLLVKTDSKVVAGHVEKEYTAKEPELIKYLAVVRAMEKKFKGFTLKHIPSGKNS